MLGNRSFGMASPRPTIGSSSSNVRTPLPLPGMMGIATPAKKLANPGVAPAPAIDDDDAQHDKENELLSELNGPPLGFVGKRVDKKKRSSRRSSIGLENLPAIDLSEEEDELESSGEVRKQNPNDVSDLLSFEEVEALHKESSSSPSSSMPPPPPRTPQHASIGGGVISSRNGGGSGSGKRSKKKRGSSGKKRKNKLRTSSTTNSSPTNHVGMHTLLLSPSLVSSAPCYATPIRPTRDSPCSSPSEPTPHPSSSNKEETVTPENFHNFLDGVKSGIANDASELWTGFQSLFGYRGVGLTSFNTIHTNNSSTFTKEEIDAEAEKIKNTFTFPSNLVSNIAASVKGPTSGIDNDAALRQRMPGLWGEGMIKHKGVTTATSTSTAPSTFVIKEGTVSNHKKSLFSPPSEKPSTPPASKQHEMTEEEVLKSTTDIVEKRGSAFGERVVHKKKGKSIGVVKKLPCTPTKKEAAASGAASRVSDVPKDPRAALLKMIAAKKPPSPPKSTKKKAAPMFEGSTLNSPGLKFGAVGDIVSIAKLEAGNGKGFSLFWVLPDGASPSNSTPSIALVLNSTRVLLISASGQTGTISWSMSRKNVKSITLSNNGPIATLLFNDESSKSFTFKTMANCFGFVQEYMSNGAKAATKKTPPRGKKTLSPPKKTLTPKRGIPVSSFDSNMSKLSKSDKEAVNKYRKMLKMRLPEPAVRHKMKQEGFEKEDLIDLVFTNEKEAGGNVEKKEKQTTKDKVQKSKLSDEDEGVLKKYRMMLKLHVPPPAVVHKMKMEEVENRLIVALFPEEGAGADKSAGKAKKDPVQLSTAEEQIAKKYRTMLKMHVPPMAVKHKMTQEGIAKNIINALFPEDTKSPKRSGGGGWKKNGGDKKGGEASDKGKKQTRTGKRTTGDTSIQLKQIHWTPLTDDQVRKSVWGKVRKTETFGGMGGKEKKNLTWTASVDNSDIKMMEELFHKRTGSLKKSSEGSKEQPGSAKKKQKKMAGLIDITRCNNIAISLKAFKEFTFDELVEILNTLDPKKKIVGDRIAFLSSVLPNDIEAKQIANFRGADEELLPAELFFKKLQGVKRVGVKIKVMETMDTHEPHLKDLLRRLQLMKRVCDQVMTSEKLQKVLETILAIGNIMNEGTNKGDVGGFTFDSLLKLTETKSVDGKMTVLDYIVTTFATKGQIDNLRLEGEFPESFQASRINFGEIIAEVRTMNGNVERCKGELKKMKTDEKTGKVDGKNEDKVKKPAAGGTKIKKGGIGGGDRGALFASIKSMKKEGGEDGGEGSADGGGRAALFASIKNRDELMKKKKNWQVENEAEIMKWKEPDKADQVESEGIKRLRTFIDTASKEMESLEKEKVRVVETCRELALYFGESGGEATTTRLLGILTSFAKSITNAILKYERKAKEESRKKAKEKANAGKNFKNSKSKFESLVKKNPQNVPPTPQAQGVQGAAEGNWKKGVGERMEEEVGGKAEEKVEQTRCNGTNRSTSPKRMRRGAVAVEVDAGVAVSIAVAVDDVSDKVEEKISDDVKVKVDPRANLLKMIASRKPPSLGTPTGRSGKKKGRKGSITPSRNSVGINSPAAGKQNNITSPNFVNERWKY